ncbi:MAG: VOC family protein [Anaerolineae bacterium]|nr:VOC family protein [Anaerolineae bacterium]
MKTNFRKEIIVDDNNKAVLPKNPNYPILELRVAFTTGDYERLVNFYCDGLGIEPADFWNNGQGRALILDMGRATLEIFDETQAQTIDQIEAGQRLSGQIRFALQVPDLETAMERLLAHGATLVHPPVITPWGDYNVRLQDPDGMQLTLFQMVDNKQV